ncbi:AAA family ATPase [Thermobifida alba]|uniref:AAA family ATPase n=1 Tax=Thermobifida alba TaxID=53522 RepID=A0ABY4KWN6_THEAE|nr:YhaN family protein [Thermobifida alba]UPT19842.1 AAA family ATPase [Thermobifida alba]
MRIDRLDLIAFGPFTDLSLPLDAPGVHIVFGPNEAGKSTALHALEQLLYGIGLRSPHTFVHGNDLRLGAVVRGADGEVLEFVRLKKRKDPLVAPDGTPLPEEALLRLLHGVDRTVFTTAFALDLKTLREGGEQLARGGGEIGEALAAAHSAHDLRRLRQRLEEERDSLFLRNGRKQAVARGVEEYRALDEQLRAARTLPTEYRSRQAAVEEARARTEDLKRRLGELRGELAGLERIAQTLPALRERAHLLRRIDELAAQGPLAPADLAHRVAQFEEQARSAQEALERTGRAVADAERELADLTMDPRLARALPQVERLARSQERVRAEEARVVELDRAAARARDRARALLREVRPDADLSDLAGTAVTPALRDRVDELHREHLRLRARLDEAREEAARQESRHATAARQLAQRPAPGSGERIAAALSAVPEDLPEAWTAAADAVGEAEAARDRVLADAGWAREDAEALAAARVPGRDQVAAVRERWRDTERERRRTDQELSRVAAERERARLELERLDHDGHVPSEEELRAAREDRDALWRRVREGDRDEAVLTAHERAAADADALADRALSAARVLVRRQELRAALDSARVESARLREEADRLAADADDLDRRWRGWWPDPVLPAPEVDAAETVLDRLGELKRCHERLTAASRALAEVRERTAAHAARLHEVLVEEGVAAPDPGAGSPERARTLLAELRELAAAELDRRDLAAREREELSRALQDAERALAEARSRHGAVQESLAAWEEEWAEVAASLSLPGDRRPGEALDDLARFARAAELAAEAEGHAAEAEALRETVAAFHGALDGLLGDCGRPVPAEAAERHPALEALHAEAEEQRRLEQRRTVLAETLESLRESARTEEARRTAAEAALAELCRQVGVSSTAELHAAVARGREAGELRAGVETLERSIVSTWDGGLAEAEAAVAGADRETLAARIAEVQEEIGRLDTEYAEAIGAWEKARGELAAVDGSEEAARAAQHRAEVLARLAEDAERYTRLLLAHTVLVRCLEEYRRAHQDPILGRAQELFAALTGHRFTGLDSDLDDSGATVLRVRRDTGEQLATHQLSEGTLDQLYLALRLATLERYAAEGRSMPFVLDDVFMAFDEERTVAGLRVLDSLADRFQPVVFTHHAHLADLALQALPEGRVHVHRLRRFAPERPASAGVRQGSGVPPHPGSSERLCRDCGSPFAHRGRGRPPARCPECR